MLTASLPDLISRALMLLIVFPAHELAHALAATAMGDPTPRAAGRLTLNPLKHLDPFGSLLFIMAGIGWARTPVNPAFFGDNARLKMGLVSFVGPLTNFMLCLAGMIPFVIFGWQPTIDPGSKFLPSLPYFFTNFMVFNLLLAVFNLLPIAPLDGASVVGAFLSGGAAVAFDMFQRYGMLALLVLVFLLPSMGIDVLGTLLNLVAAPVFGLLYVLLHIRGLVFLKP
jgi:Zn-dependent protease